MNLTQVLPSTSRCHPLRPSRTRLNPVVPLFVGICKVLSYHLGYIFVRSQKLHLLNRLRDRVLGQEETLSL